MAALSFSAADRPFISFVRFVSVLHGRSIAKTHNLYGHQISWGRWFMSWGLIGLFSGLTAGYAWFAVVMPPDVFEGIGAASD